MSPLERLSRPPTHDETAADVADSATAVGPMPAPARRIAARAFWWLAHHVVARPLAIAFPARHTSRFSAWTLDRRNM